MKNILLQTSKKNQVSLILTYEKSQIYVKVYSSTVPKEM